MGKLVTTTCPTKKATCLHANQPTYLELENYYMEKDKKINFRNNDKQNFLCTNKAKDSVHTLQEDLSTAFLLLLPPVRSNPSLLPQSPPLARLPWRDGELWGLQNGAQQFFPWSWFLPSHAHLDGGFMQWLNGSEFVDASKFLPSFPFSFPCFALLHEDYIGGIIVWFIYTVIDSCSDVGAKSVVPFAEPVLLSSTAWQWQFHADTYGVVAVYILHPYELILLYSGLWRIQGRLAIFTTKDTTVRVPASALHLPKGSLTLTPNSCHRYLILSR